MHSFETLQIKKIWLTRPLLHSVTDTQITDCNFNQVVSPRGQVVKGKDVVANDGDLVHYAATDHLRNLLTELQ